MGIARLPQLQHRACNESDARSGNDFGWCPVHPLHEVDGWALSFDGIQEADDVILRIGGVINVQHDARLHTHRQCFDGDFCGGVRLSRVYRRKQGVGVKRREFHIIIERFPRRAEQQAHEAPLPRQFPTCQSVPHPLRQRVRYRDIRCADTVPDACRHATHSKRPARSTIPAPGDSGEAAGACALACRVRDNPQALPPAMLLRAGLFFRRRCPSRCPTGDANRFHITVAVERRADCWRVHGFPTDNCPGRASQWRWQSAVTQGGKVEVDRQHPRPAPRSAEYRQHLHRCSHVYLVESKRPRMAGQQVTGGRLAGKLVKKAREQEQ